MLLYSVPASFENFRVVIESRDVLPTPDNLRMKITEEYDARKNTKTSNSNQSAMYVQKNKQKNKREKGKRRFSTSSVSSVINKDIDSLNVHSKRDRQQFCECSSFFNRGEG